MKNKKRNFLLIWILALALLLNVLAFVPVVAEGEEIEDKLLTSFKMVVQYTVGEPIIVDSNGTDQSPYELDLSSIEYISLTYGLTIPDGKDVAGKQFIFDLPAFYNGSPVQDKELKLNNSEVVLAHYSVKEKSEGGFQVVVSFTEQADGHDDVSLDIFLGGSFDTSVFEDKFEIDVVIPFEEEYKFTLLAMRQDKEDAQDSKTVGKGYVLDSEGTKTKVDINPEYVDWTILVNDAAKEIGKAVVTDTLPMSLTLDKGSFVIERIIRNYNNVELRREAIGGDEINSMLTFDGNGFSLNLGSIAHAYEITYTTIINRPGAGEHGITNSAEIDLDNEKEPVTGTFTGNWSDTLPILQKVGDWNTSDRNLVKWTVKYNYGKEPLGDVTLTDFLGEEQGTIDLTSLVIQQVNTDDEGNVQGNVGYPVTEIASIVDGKLIITGLDANEKAYLITFESEVPVGLKDASITNTVRDDQESPPASDTVTVNTIPTGGKIANQKVDNEGNPYVEWTITINPDKVNVGKIEIVDLFDGTLMSFMPGQSGSGDPKLITDGIYKLTKNGDDVIDATSYTVSHHTGPENKTGFKLTIDSVGKNEYKFVYQTYYTTLGMQLGNAGTANAVDFTFYTPPEDGGTGGDPGVGTEIPGGDGGTLSVDISGPNPGIEKAGEYVVVETDDSFEQEILWTVTFNTSKIMLDAGTTLTDVFESKNFGYVEGSLVVYKDSVNTDNKLTLDTDYSLAHTGASGADKENLVVTLIEETKSIIIVTFLTTSDDTKNEDQTNKAVLKWKETEFEVEKNLGKRTAGVTKTGTVVVDDAGNKTINWVVKFNSNKNVLYDFKLTDTFTPGTMAMVGPPTLHKDGTSDALSSDAEYTYTEPTNNSGDFTINIPKLDPVEYTLRYTTTLSPEDERGTINSTNEYIVNKAEIEYIGNTENTSAKILKPKLGITKAGALKSRGTIDQKPVISWTIFANTDKTNKYVNLVDAVLKDTIPLDQKLRGDSISVSRVDDSAFVFAGTIKKTSNSFEIELPNGPYQYKVTFQTEIIEMPSQDETDFDRYNNDATLTNHTNDDGLSRTVSANANIRYFPTGTNNLTAKNGAQNLDTENIDYTLTLNPESLTIHNAKITDKLFTDDDDMFHTFILDSIIVLQGGAKGDNNEITYEKLTLEEDYNLTLFDDGRRFEIDFEVNSNLEGTIDKPLQVVYSTRLNDDIIGPRTLVNRVALTGGVGNKELHFTEETTRAAQWFYGGGGTGKTLTLRIRKADIHGAPIKDTQFKLIRVNLNDEESVLGTFTTNDDGIILQENYLAGRYILEEVHTPTLYQALDGPVYFTIGYTDPKDYEYEDDDGLLLNPYTVTIMNEQWKPATHSHAVADGGTLVVTNDYNPTSVTFKANKILVGQPLWADQFQFELRDHETNVLETVGNDADGLVTFTQITYSDTGEFTYTLREVDKDQGGMTYDTTVYTINVVVSEGDNGLEAEVTYLLDGVESQPTFSNEYKASGSFTANFEKSLDGGGRNLEDGEFTFVLTPVDGAPLRTSAEGDRLEKVETTNDSDGNFSFKLFFNQDDLNLNEEFTVYEYIVSEKDLGEYDDDFGMEYDTKKVTITVTLQDLRNGEIKVIDNYDGGEGNDIDFRNTYKAFGQWRPEVTKQLKGRALRDKEFEFELISYGKIQPFSVPIGDIEEPLTIQNDGSGVVTFEWIEFSEDDIGQTYEFLLSEVKPDSPEGGMSYDESIYLIEVAISDAGNGVLAFDTTYYLGEETAEGTNWEPLEDDSVTFTNSYTGLGSWTPNVTKELVGRELKDEEFEFVLKGPQGNVIEKVKNDADGNVTFGYIAYNQSDIGGSYTYTIEEIVGDEPGMSYDTRPIEITVYVTDARNGQLNVDVRYPAVTTFVNRYSGPSGITVTANKVWKDLPSGWTEHLPTIWFKLYRSVEGGTAEAVPGLAMQNLPAGVTQVSWNGLEKYDPDGELYVYSVKEVDENGKDYEPKYFEKTEKGLTVTNAFINERVEGDEDFDTKIDVTGHKVWKGVPKGQTVPTIWLKLYRHIEGGTPVAVAGRPIMELRPGVTQGTWKDLEKVDDDYNYYIYSVKEVDNKGNDYEPPHFRKTEEGLTVTNTHTAGAPVTGETLSVYTIMGAMLMALAALFLILTGRKRAKAK